MKLFVRDKTLNTIHYFAEADGYSPAGNEEEITDIVSFEKIGGVLLEKAEQYLRDKKSLRDGLKPHIYAKMQVAAPADVEDPAKWALLSTEEKAIAVRWFIVGNPDFQNEVVNDDKFWTLEAGKYRSWTMRARKSRLDCLEALVFRRVLDISDAKQVLADMNQLSKDTVLDIDAVTGVLQNKARVKRLTSMYVEGLESSADDGITALKDYIDSTAGTPFENNGFRSLPYAFRGSHTADSVADELLTIIDGTW